ncbi:MAG TPA: DUF6516 family protein [Anaerolineae bacterium]|nr:DUF6516 family protein [Anaerolineae bacterium]
MTTLAEALSFVVTTLQGSPMCSAVRVVETHQFSDLQFALKVRADLVRGGALQVRLYYNDRHVDYAYQLFRADQPVLRWDNKEHFPGIATYPHHFHTPTGHVGESPFNGDPSHDLPLVLDYLATFSG